MGSINDRIVTDNITDVLAAQYNALLGSNAKADWSNGTTMTGTVTLTDADYMIQRFNCNGANRIVKLPAYSVDNHPFFIINATGAAYTLDVQSNAGISILTALLSDGQNILVIPSGTEYQAVGTQYQVPGQYQLLAQKDVSGGYVGLTLLKINFTNAANTFVSFLQNMNTAARTYTFRNRDTKVGERIVNYSTASQSPAATVRTYITGSAIAVPADGLEVGTILRWHFNMTKTAAGIAASTFDIAFGTTGTVSDTARVSFVKPAGTAAADEAWVIIECIVRGPIGASGIVAGHFQMSHNLNATGHAVIANVNVQSVSAAFDLAAANLIIGVCVTTGAADVITIQQVTCEAINL